MHSPRAISAVSLLFIGLCSALHVRRSVDFYNPTGNGGSLLNNAGNGLGEPLNVIISSKSSSAVLTDIGIVNYARAIGFSTECIVGGNPQSANLGDGNGWVNQTLELREDYRNIVLGACLESLIGGNHFRVFRQNGSLADSDALFSSVQRRGNETCDTKNLFVFRHHHLFQPITLAHTIVPNGYNIGRDELVRNAVGQTSYAGVSYLTTAENITGLLAPGSTGVNHGIAQDGIVTLLTVTIQ